MLELYEAAEELGVEIYTGNIPNCVSFSIPGYVALDYRLIEDGREERCAAAHELGHNARSAFYLRDDPLYIKQRCENKANRWAIKKLIPEDEFTKALQLGLTEVWEIADYFNVTEEYAYMAMWFYKYGNLSLPKCS